MLIKLNKLLFSIGFCVFFTQNGFCQIENSGNYITYKLNGKKIAAKSTNIDLINKYISISACNQINAKIEMQKNGIVVVQNISQTKKACSEPNFNEQLFVSSLKNCNTFVVKKDSLILQNKKLKTTIHFILSQKMYFQVQNFWILKTADTSKIFSANKKNSLLVNSKTDRENCTVYPNSGDKIKEEITIKFSKNRVKSFSLWLNNKGDSTYIILPTATPDSFETRLRIEDTKNGTLIERKWKNNSIIQWKKTDNNEFPIELILTKEFLTAHPLRKLQFSFAPLIGL